MIPMSCCVLFTVQFSNGSIKTTDKLDFTMYKNRDEINPRKKHRQILVRRKRRFVLFKIWWHKLIRRFVDVSLRLLSTL